MQPLGQLDGVGGVLKTKDERVNTGSTLQHCHVLTWGLHHAWAMLSSSQVDLLCVGFSPPSLLFGNDLWSIKSHSQSPADTNISEQIRKHLKCIETYLAKAAALCYKNGGARERCLSQQMSGILFR